MPSNQPRLLSVAPANLECRIHVHLLSPVHPLCWTLWLPAPVQPDGPRTQGRICLHTSYSRPFQISAPQVAGMGKPDTGPCGDWCISASGESPTFRMINTFPILHTGCWCTEASPAPSPVSAKGPGVQSSGLYRLWRARSPPPPPLHPRSVVVGAGQSSKATAPFSMQGWAVADLGRTGPLRASCRHARHWGISYYGVSGKVAMATSPFRFPPSRSPPCH